VSAQLTTPASAYTSRAEHDPERNDYVAFTASENLVRCGIPLGKMETVLACTKIDRSFEVRYKTDAVLKNASTKRNTNRTTSPAPARLPGSILERGVFVYER